MRLPPLREDLILREGPRTHDGQPSWTIQDPSRNKFFHLDWLTFEILSRWWLQEPHLIARKVHTETTLTPSEADVLAVGTFANANQLLATFGADNSAALARAQAQARPGAFLWLIHNYLFFRIPLVRPDKLLQKLHAPLAFLFTPAFWKVTALAAIAGLWLALRDPQTLQRGYADLLDPRGIAGLLLLLVGVKIVHEFGHGLCARHFGCRVPAMGIAFLVMTPVAYTDTNEAWGLRSRRQRLLVGAAGMLAEVGLAAWATLLWCLLPDGALRQATLMLASVSWVKSLLVNCSPIMRFDGYYLLSDALDLPNLHARCFALGRWQLREWLFGLGEPPPEHFSRGMRRLLVALAIVIWIYRLVVFTGIAIFVYHYFFKALGIVLFLVEIGWFIVLPMLSEAKEWVARRRAIAGKARSYIAPTVGLLALILCCVPLPRTIELQGVLVPAAEYRVQLPEPGRLTTSLPRDNTTVEAGQRLVSAQSDLLLLRRDQSRVRLAALQGELNAAISARSERAPVIAHTVDVARASLAEAEEAIEQLSPRAPAKGLFRAAALDVRVGEWVPAHEQLGVVIGEGAWTVRGYLAETDRHLLGEEHGTAFFYPEGGAGRIALSLTRIEEDATRKLPEGMLASTHGGAVRTRPSEGSLHPEEAVYAVLFSCAEQPAGNMAMVRRGAIVIRAGSEAPLVRWGRAALSVVWRELGF